MHESAVVSDSFQRELIEKTIRQHCDIRGWKLHAVNCRSNHCHVVVTASGYSGNVVRDQFKSWGTRRLKEDAAKRKPSELPRERWWTT